MGDCNCVGLGRVAIDCIVRLKLPKLHGIQDMVIIVTYTLNLLIVVSIFKPFPNKLTFPDQEQPDLMYILYMCGYSILGRFHIRWCC